MIYRILLSDVMGSNEVRTSRKRADAAKLAAERIVYDVIAGQGGLDTERGHKIMAAVQAIDPRRGGSVQVYDRMLFFTCSHA